MKGVTIQQCYVFSPSKPWNSAVFILFTKTFSSDVPHDSRSVRRTLKDRSVASANHTFRSFRVSTSPRFRSCRLIDKNTTSPSYPSLIIHMDTDDRSSRYPCRGRGAYRLEKKKMPLGPRILVVGHWADTWWLGLCLCKFTTGTG